MVHGLKKFKKYFNDYTNQYVLIGGTACDILMADVGAPFRATRDLDIVLIIDALNSAFVKTFFTFIEDGGYKHRIKSTGEIQFYRFTEPEDPSFPFMIELFSKKPENVNLKFEVGLTPIHIDDDVVSLSAILLNDVYYNLLINGKRTIDGYSVIEMETLILFKIKAWIDLREKKEAGEKIDLKNIKKHKNDVFRLLANIIPSGRMEIADEIRKDIVHFVELVKKDKPDIKNLRIKDSSFRELMEVLESVFNG